MHGDYVNFKNCCKDWTFEIKSLFTVYKITNEFLWTSYKGPLVSVRLVEAENSEEASVQIFSLNESHWD